MASAATKRGRLVLRSLAKELLFEHDRRLASVYLAEAFPEAALIEARCTLDTLHDWELPYAERVVLDGIARALDPDLVFEFGTFTGRTTQLLATAAPRAVVHTIDLPAPTSGEDVVGREYRGQPVASRVIQHRADSQAFDFSGLVGRVDLVFVDASHEYPNVVGDSESALGLVATGGTIVWDDYHPRHPGVYRALNELGRRVEIRHVARTRLAIHRRPTEEP